MKYYRLMFKCLDCGFHFVGLTWHYDEWKKRLTEEKKKAYCPECGATNTFLLGVEEVEGHIWEVCGAKQLPPGEKVYSAD